MSIEQQMHYLIEHGQAIDSRFIDTVHTAYAEWLWSHGQNVVTNPLWEGYGDREGLMKEYAEGIKKSLAYMKKATEIYKAFPFESFDKVEAKFYEKFPNEQITERGLLRFGKNLDNALSKSTPLQINFKNAIPVSIKEITGYLKRAIYVRIYFKETYETYKIVNVEKEKPVLIAHIEDNKLIIDKPKNPDMINTEIELKSENPEQSIKLKEEPKDIIARLPLRPKRSEGEIPAYNLAMDFWKKIAGDNTNPDLNWMKREKVHAKKLIKLGLTTEDVLNIYAWRIQNDQNGFWVKKLYSLGIIFSHLSDWSVEAKYVPPTFEDFLKKNPELEYRNINIIDAHSAYIKASLCKQALEKARKAGVVLTDKDFETLYKASKIKIDVFNGEKK